MPFERGSYVFILSSKSARAEDFWASSNVLNMFWLPLSKSSIWNFPLDLIRNCWSWGHFSPTRLLVDIRALGSSWSLAFFHSEVGWNTRGWSSCWRAKSKILAMNSWDEQQTQYVYFCLREKQSKGKPKVSDPPVPQKARTSWNSKTAQNDQCVPRIGIVHSKMMILQIGTFPRNS